MTDTARNGTVPWYRSIRLRLVAAAIIIELSMLGLLLANSYRLLNEALESQSHARMEALTPLLNASIAGLVFQRNHIELEQVLKQLTHAELTDIPYIAIYDRRGELMTAIGKFDPKNPPVLDRDVAMVLGTQHLIYDKEIDLRLLDSKVGTARFGLSLVNMVASRDDVVQQGMLIAALEILLSLLLLTTGGYLLTRHLTELLNATRRVARGDYVSRIDIGGSDEIGLLADNFNSMAAAVEDRVRQLGESEERFREVFDNINDAIVVREPGTGNILLANNRMCEMYGYSHDEILRKSVGDFSAGTPPYTREVLTLKMQETTSEKPHTFEWLAMHKDGHLFWIEISLRRVMIGRYPRLVSVIRDISERKQAEVDLRAANEELETLIENVLVGILITVDGRIVRCNHQFLKTLGYDSAAELLGKPTTLFFTSIEDYQHFSDAVRPQLVSTGMANVEWKLMRRDGLLCWMNVGAKSVTERVGSYRTVWMMADISEVKEHQDRLEHLAHYDALTRLPNRVLMMDRLRQAIAQSERSQKLLAVGYLDLDGFKPINDTLGHEAGDQLLIETARRFGECMRAGDTACRLGGDEFVLLVASLNTVEECNQTFSRVLSAIAAPYRISDQDVSISASIGITIFPMDGSDPDTLLRHADQAMYVAKQSGRNRFHLFDPKFDQLVQARHEARSRIEEALRREEFVLHYQPKVNMRSGKVIGVEALIRWRHPDKGQLAPAEFLPVIEDTDFAIPLGEWVLHEALSQIDAWRKSGLQLTVSINIAARHLQFPGFVERLGRLLDEYSSLPPSAVELEILETAALEDMVLVSEVMAACHKLGVTFALDDFGTGYSSLSYFKRLQVDYLKIDQSFVRDLLIDEEDRAIVEGVISLAHAFRRHVIAEGVETAEIGMALLHMGCELAQGYGIARPMPGADIPAWIESYRPDARWSNVPPLPGA